MTFCFICGKVLKDEEKYKAGKYGVNAHHKCYYPRIVRNWTGRKERWKRIMADSEIRKRIKEIDKKMLKGKRK